MKKKKLLSLMSMVVLLFSLGGCSKEEEEEIVIDNRDPVSDLFEAIKEDNNYTLLIDYYYIYTTEKFSSLDDLYEYYAYYLDYQDLWVKITYTNEAMLIEYYADYLDYLLYNPVDTELLVNTSEGLRVYQVYDYYSQDLDYTYTLEGYTWQNYANSLLDLYNFAFNFERSDAVDSEDGEILTYNINGLSNYHFMEYFMYSLFYGGNYFCYDLGLINGILSLVGNGYSSDIEYTCNYYVDYDMWMTTLDSGTQIYYDASYQYYLEWDMFSSAIYNVGTSSIPSDYQQYLL
ncbi:MAG: hypothetical protein LUD22_04305 [Coprobacillus sp.]|nr:hypothetical protein [Coprobacillus sp.]